MAERRRPFRRGKRPSSRTSVEPGTEAETPYRDDADGGAPEGDAPAAEMAPPPVETPPPTNGPAPDASPAPEVGFRETGQFQRPYQNNGHPGYQGGGGGGGGNRRGRRNRRRGRDGRGGPPPHPQQQQHQHQQSRGGYNDAGATPVTPDGETTGWYDIGRDGGFVRRQQNSYLAEPGDAWIPPQFVRQYSLRRGDEIHATVGHDHRGRTIVCEVLEVNQTPAGDLQPRADFSSLTATYPERHLKLETGRPAKGGPELTRRCIDLMAPIGYGQRALIVAPARAGKTMLLHAITEGIALNHPEAVLLILLVDERPEEVSEAISWGVGEVVASSFDQKANRHVEVTEIVLERARRLVELGRDVIIVLDSLTRMARAHNTAERGTGRTLSGGLDATAMAKPKAFFGSARSVAPKDGGGSITIIATALVETGSRMDDVIFEEFKGTGNCEIKLDRSLAEKRIFPAFDIAASGTRREEKLYRPEQIDAIYALRRGLQQMPPQAAMEWMIKRIASTPSNDALLQGL